MWKNVIVEETMKNKKNGSLDTKNSVKSESLGTEASDGNGKRVQRVNSMKVDKVSKTEKNDQSTTKTIKTEIHTTEKTVKTEQKTTGEHVKVEKVTKEEKQNSDVRKLAPPPKLGSVIYCKDALRDKIRELLSEALLKVYNEIAVELRGEVDACDPYRVAVSLESAMFDKWGKSNGAHKFKYRSIMFNIKDAQNPDFRRKVLLGHVKPVRVLEMTPEEMASNERQMQNGKIKEKALFDCERGGPPKATTDQFKCGRCGKKQCTYYQMQTRSADEPMTTFVTCVNCDNHWKFC